MSEAVMVAVVAEGLTDLAMLGAAMAAMLPDRDLVLTYLQPETSAAFGVQHQDLGEGWPGVCRWCSQAIDQAGGALRDNPLFVSHNLLVVQLDADVAEKRYRDAGLDDRGDLPCDQPCPPPNATTDALRSVLLGWLGESSTPPQTVLCTPSRSLEAWVLAALYPGDKFVGSGGIECRREPEALLSGKPREGRLISGKSKDTEAYRRRAGEFGAAWDRVRAVCGEAERFAKDFMAAVA